MISPDIANISGVGVAAIAVYLLYKIVANHINANTKVLGDLKDAIVELRNFLENKQK